MAQTFFPITPTEIVASGADEWVTMDASGSVPEGATGVILHLVNTNVDTNWSIGIRKNGSSDDRFATLSKGCHCWAMIGVDESRYFEAEVGSTTDIDIWIVGYTKSGVAFKTNADDMSLGDTGDWYPIDCNTEAPGAIGLIFEILTSGIYEFGLRKNGSSDDRHGDSYYHNQFGAVIGCDASKICEGYIESTAVDFFLVGYITDGATFNTNATDISLGTTGSWLDLSALPDVSPAPNIGFIETLDASNASVYDFGLRKNGSGEDIYYGMLRRCWGIVECDASRLIEGKIEDTNVDFFVVGYSEAAAGWSGKVSGVTDPAKVMGVDKVNINKVKGVASA